MSKVKDLLVVKIQEFYTIETIHSHIKVQNTSVLLTPQLWLIIASCNP